jgi:hypothetical protein
MGAVVTKDTDDFSIVVANPTKIIKKNKEKNLGTEKKLNKVDETFTGAEELLFFQSQSEQLRKKFNKHNIF